MVRPRWCGISYGHEMEFGQALKACPVTSSVMQMKVNLVLFKDRYLMEFIPHLLIEGMIVSSLHWVAM